MTELSFSICPKLECGEGDKVFFYLKDPTIIVENTGLTTPVFYLIEATITKEVILNCHSSQYTFSYDETKVTTALTKAHIDKICCQDCNTQFIREMIARL